MTRKFQSYSGENGIVVAPSAWMFHKGLTFPRRKSASKVYKDLYGIWYVATQLGTFSEEAIVELLFLRSQYPKWFKTFQNNLHRWIDGASPLEWTKLEAQDPHGKLKKLAFERIINAMVLS